MIGRKSSKSRENWALQLRYCGGNAAYIVGDSRTWANGRHGISLHVEAEVEQKTMDITSTDKPRSGFRDDDRGVGMRDRLDRAIESALEDRRIVGTVVLVNDVTVVALTNTAFEGMIGRFTVDIRNAVYGA